MGSNAVGGRVSEDAGEENNDSKTYNPSLNTVRARPRITNPTGEGRSSSLERLVRPALSGRKALKKTSNRDSRGRQREGHSYRVDERLNTEHVVIREKEKQRPGKSGRRCRDGAQDRQERGSTESLSRSNSDIQLNSTLESGDGSNVHGRQTCLRPCSCECTSTNRAYLSRQSSRPALRSISSANGQSTSQTRSTPLSPQRPPSRTAAGDLDHYSFSSSSEPDPFWVDVRSGAGTDLLSLNHHTQTHLPSLTTREIGGEGEEEVEEDEEVEDDVEEGSGVMEMMSQTMTSAASPPCISFGETGISKRERNRMKCLRRRQRRREKCRQSQLQESRQNSPGNPSTSSSEEDEDLGAGEREGYICAVCLDVYFSPYMCHPCNHIFCEPCLRTLAKNNPTNTPCPLCRTIITHVFFQKELNQSAKTFYPKEYLARKQNFQKASCAKWPLPSCRKLFRIFGGFQRQASPIARHQLPHGGGYRLNGMDFQDDTRGWRFDMNMVIIYIFSVNWVIGFFILFFICYLFFPSF